MWAITIKLFNAMCKKVTFFPVLIFSLFFSCEFPVGSKTFTVDEGIIKEELFIKFVKKEQVENFSLELKEQVNCDILLDLYDMHQDSLVFKETIDVKDLKKQELWRDWYSNFLILKLNDTSSLECDKLTLILGFSYINK